MIFWLVMKHEISYNRVIIFWRIFWFLLKDFIENYIFAWWNNIWVSIILLLFALTFQHHGCTHIPAKQSHCAGHVNKSANKRRRKLCYKGPCNCKCYCWILKICQRISKTKATNDGNDHITNSRKQEQGQGNVFLQCQVQLVTLFVKVLKGQKGFWIFYLVCYN